MSYFCYTLNSWFCVLSQLLSHKKKRHSSQIKNNCLINSKWQLTSWEFRTQITKLHHQVVKCKVAHCTLYCSGFLKCFFLLLSVLKLRGFCFPICPFSGLSLHSLFALDSSIRPTSLLLSIPFSILHFVAFISSCFHFGEEGIHTEELETDLGKIFTIWCLKQKLCRRFLLGKMTSYDPAIFEDWSSLKCCTKCGNMISSVHIIWSPSFWILSTGRGGEIF